MLSGIYIKGEGFIRVESEERFARILEERLGDDAAVMFRDYISKYHDAIEEALNELDEVGETDSEANNVALEAAKDALERVMW